MPLVDHAPADAGVVDHAGDLPGWAAGQVGELPTQLLEPLGGERRVPLAVALVVEALAPLPDVDDGGVVAEAGHVAAELQERRRVGRVHGVDSGEEGGTQARRNASRSKTL